MAEDFGANLVELAVASFLRALAAEHWADVVELLVAGEGLHVVFDVGAADGGGGFGAEYQVLTQLHRVSRKNHFEYLLGSRESLWYRLLCRDRIGGFDERLLEPSRIRCEAWYL